MGPAELVLIVVWLVVAGVAGFAAAIITRSRYRFILDTGVALVGAVVGGLAVTGAMPGGVTPLSGGGILLALVTALVSAVTLKLTLRAMAPFLPPRGDVADEQGKTAAAPRPQTPLTIVEAAPEAGAVSALASPAPSPRANLRRLLEENLSLEEGRTLAFDLDVSYDSLPGEGHAAKMRELVKYLDQRGQLDRILAWLRTNRLDIDLPGDPASRVEGERDPSNRS